MKHNRIFISLIFSFSLTATLHCQAQEDWENVVDGGEYQYDVKLGSLRSAKTPTGKEAYFVVGQVRDTLTKRTLIAK